MVEAQYKLDAIGIKGSKRELARVYDHDHDHDHERGRGRGRGRLFLRSLESLFEPPTT